MQKAEKKFTMLFKDKNISRGEDNHNEKETQKEEQETLSYKL